MASQTGGIHHRNKSTRKASTEKEIEVPSSSKRLKSGPVADDNFDLLQAVNATFVMISSVLPTLASWGMTFGLIFGGCCSNVFTLEKIIKEEPESGLLITFVQFVVTALFTWPHHFSASHPPFFLKPRAIPLIRWLPNIVLFFTVNLLNNFVFGYNISVPVHIILRSGGSVTTMLVGYVWGKRYSRWQIFSVAMLTAGVIVAAMSDARSKGKTTTTTTTSTSSSSANRSFLTGFSILVLAQLLSAIMGLYTQLTYAKYGAHWHENLFYSHFLSIPFFLPFLPSLRSELTHLLSSPPFIISPSFPSLSPLPPSSSPKLNPRDQLLENSPLPLLSTPSWPPSLTLTLPRQIINLALNALTQYACIRGVNLLSARTTAIGVTIVLNVRKLISLFVSIWVFGNKLPAGVLVGAAIVFSSAGVWAVEGQRLNSKGKKDGNKDDNEKSNGNEMSRKKDDSGGRGGGGVVKD